MNPPLTLGAIRAQFSTDDAWWKLLNRLSDDTPVPMSTEVSLGDVARACGAGAALESVGAPLLGWADIAFRRAVIGALLPTLRRAHGAQLPRYLADLIIFVFMDGRSGVDLIQARKLARSASRGATSPGAGWAADAARAAIGAALGVEAWQMLLVSAAASAEAALAARAAARISVSGAGARAVVVAAMARAAERARQVADLVAAFPPLHEGISRAASPTVTAGEDKQAAGPVPVPVPVPPALPLVVLTVSGGVLTIEAVGGACRIVVVDLDREGERLSAAEADEISRPQLWEGPMAEAENAAADARVALGRYVTGEDEDDA